MVRTNDLNDGYLGSGIHLKSAISKYGRDNFSREILEFADTEERLFELERTYVSEDWISSNRTYNAKIGGFGGWGGYSRDRRSRVAKEVWKRDGYREKHSKIMLERWKDPKYVEFQKNHPKMKNRFGGDNPAEVSVEVDGIKFETKRNAANHFGVSIPTISRWIKNGRGRVLSG